MIGSSAPSATDVIAALLLQGLPSGSELSRCEPEALFLTANWHHVLLATYSKLAALPELPADFLDVPWLKDEIARRIAYRSLLQKELRRIAEALSAAGVTAIALKSAAYLATEDPQRLTREMSDLDVLVHSGSLLRATKALRGLGYRETQQDAEHHTVLERTVGQAPLLVELHTELLSSATAGQTAGVLLWLSRHFWGRSRPVSQELSHLRVLDAPDALVHSALHLAFHHFPPKLKWLMDLAGYARQIQEEQWYWLTAALEGTPAEIPFAFALLLLQNYSPEALPGSMVSWAAKHPRAKISADLTVSLFSQREIYKLSLEQGKTLHTLHLRLMGSAETLHPHSPTQLPFEAIPLLAAAPDDQLPEMAQWLTWIDIRGPSWVRMAMLIKEGPDLLKSTSSQAKLFRLLASSGPWPQGERHIWKAIGSSSGNRQALMTKLYCLGGLGGSLREMLPLILPDLFPPSRGLLSRLLLPAYGVRNLLALPGRFWVLLASLWCRRLLRNAGKR
jgi:hypothetical protein